MYVLWALQRQVYHFISIIVLWNKYHRCRYLNPMFTGTPCSLLIFIYCNTHNNNTLINIWSHNSTLKSKLRSKFVYKVWFELIYTLNKAATSQTNYRLNKLFLVRVIHIQFLFILYVIQLQPVLCSKNLIWALNIYVLPKSEQKFSLFVLSLKLV